MEQPWEEARRPSWDGAKPFFRLITPKRILWLVLAIIVIAILATGFYTVDTDGVAVVLRFGKYVRQTEPGLHFKLPLGIETAEEVPVRKVFKEEFGFPSGGSPNPI